MNKNQWKINQNLQKSMNNQAKSMKNLNQNQWKFNQNQRKIILNQWKINQHLQNQCRSFLRLSLFFWSHPPPRFARRSWLMVKDQAFLGNWFNLCSSGVWSVLKNLDLGGRTIPPSGWPRRAGAWRAPPQKIQNHRQNVSRHVQDAPRRTQDAPRHSKDAP